MDTITKSYTIISGNPVYRPHAGICVITCRQLARKSPIIVWVADSFHEFHEILMGKEPEKTDKYIEKHTNTELSSFCNGLKNDIVPVKNAISLDVSSGFVEGNNNNFKLIKRIVYGWSKIVNLTKKCKLAFLIKTDDFSLIDLI